MSTIYQHHTSKSHQPSSTISFQSTSSVAFLTLLQDCSHILWLQSCPFGVVPTSRPSPGSPFWVFPWRWVRFSAASVWCCHVKRVLAPEQQKNAKLGFCLHHWELLPIFRRFRQSTCKYPSLSWASCTKIYHHSLVQSQNTLEISWTCYLATNWYVHGIFSCSVSLFRLPRPHEIALRCQWLCFYFQLRRRVFSVENHSENVAWAGVQREGPNFHQVQGHASWNWVHILSSFEWWSSFNISSSKPFNEQIVSPGNSLTQDEAQIKLVCAHAISAILIAIVWVQQVAQVSHLACAFMKQKLEYTSQLKHQRTELQTGICSWHFDAFGRYVPPWWRCLASFFMAESESGWHPPNALEKNYRMACNGRWKLIVLSIKEIWSQWTKLWVLWSSNS